jgi:hypothetical protein
MHYMHSSVHIAYPELGQHSRYTDWAADWTMVGTQTGLRTEPWLVHRLGYGLNHGWYTDWAADWTMVGTQTGLRTEPLLVHRLGCGRNHCWYTDWAADWTIVGTQTGLQTEPWLVHRLGCGLNHGWYTGWAADWTMVGTQTGLQTEPQFLSLYRQQICLFNASRLALGPSQPPVQWVLGTVPKVQDMQPLVYFSIHVFSPLVAIFDISNHPNI